MKALVLSLLTLITINMPDGKAGAQNVWYVDRDATGSNTGRSWTDAWTSLDSSAWMGWGGVNWTIISGGDSIYVSGGTDSTTYRPPQDNLYSGIRREVAASDVLMTFNETVIVAPAWQSNHNGDVYFVTNNDNTYGIFHLKGVNNVKVTGMNFVDRRTQATTKRNPMIEVYGNNNIIENSLIYNNNITTGVYLEGDSLTLKDNVFEYVEDATAHDWDTDAIGTSSGGNFTIDGNSFYFRNTQVTEAHRDALQLNYADGGTGVINMTVKNNLFIVKEGGWYWNSLIYSSVAYSDANWYIYNNIFVTLETADASAYGALFFYNSEGDDIKAYVFNNTFIMDDPGSGGSTPINIGDTDTLIIKNNLIITDAPISFFLNLDNFVDNGVYYREVDYNAYYEYGGLSGNFYTGEITSMTYAQWTNPANNNNGDIYDAHSLTGNSTAVTFADKYGENKVDYLTTTGRDVGVDLAEEYPDLLEIIPDLRYDILGNPRRGAWDMGALEFQGGPQNGIDVKGKVFLQGPFSSNVMSTSLNQGGYLPDSQPYNSPPWNYNGSESFYSGPGSTMVEWVLVELRSSSNPSQVVARRAAVLKNNGLLLEPNGMEGVFFNNVDPGSYYIAIFHRNHLAIMSSSPVQLSSNSQVYDFTTAMNKAYGQDPMVELGAGKYGMFASDGNGDGIINSPDNDIYLEQRGTMGYKDGDFNLDSGVSVYDINQLWNLNNGAVTQVP